MDPSIDPSIHRYDPRDIYTSFSLASETCLTFFSARLLFTPLHSPPPPPVPLTAVREQNLLRRTVGRILNSRPAAAYDKWLDFVGYKRLLPRHAQVMLKIVRAMYATHDKRQVMRALQTWRHYAFFMGERLVWERKMQRRTMDKYMGRMMNGKVIAAYRAW